MPWTLEAGQAIRLDDAISKALKGSPSLLAQEYRLQVADAQIKQANALPNPEIEGEVENVAGSGEFSGTDSAEYTVMLSQSIPLGGARSKQVRVASLDRRLAEWQLEGVKRDLIHSVKRAFTDVLANQEQLHRSAELLTLAEELVKTAERRVKSGAASILEQTKADIERAAILAEREQVKPRLVASQTKLASLLGIAVDQLGSVEGNLYQIQDLPSFKALKVTLSDHPDWARGVVEMEQREAVVALANSQVIPEVNVGVGWRRDEASGSDAFVFSAGMPLPLFNRNQGAREAAVHEQSASQEDRRAMERELEADLADAYSELSQARSLATSISEYILPAANKAFDVSREGYLQGRFGYLDLLDAQRTLFDAKGDYIESLRNYQRAQADVERLTVQPPSN